MDVRRGRRKANVASSHRQKGQVCLCNLLSLPSMLPFTKLISTVPSFLNLPSRAWPQCFISGDETCSCFDLCRMFSNRNQLHRLQYEGGSCGHAMWSYSRAFLKVTYLGHPSTAFHAPDYGPLYQLFLSPPSAPVCHLSLVCQ